MDIRESIPICGRFESSLDSSKARLITELAARILHGEPTIADLTHFGGPVDCGLPVDGPALLIADQSEIPLFGEPEELSLEYRAAALARAGDILVLSHGRSRSFERYLKDFLDVTVADVLPADSSESDRRWPLPKRCLYRPELFGHIADHARASGGLCIAPYLSTGHLWNLAGEVARASGSSVTVAAPPPRLSRRVNDKIWFSNRVRELFGNQALSSTTVVYGPSALAGHVRRLAKSAERLVVKVPDSAGSSGNLALNAADFRDSSTAVVRQRLVELLSVIGWSRSFPFKLEIWESDTLTSPSVQLWIPHEKDGLPVVEGLFEQVVEGERGKFVGAIRCQLPDIWQKRLVDQGVLLASLFQRLGYFGRCSLDALISGPSFDDARLHWIECNGRWGGVSLPMTLANRLLSQSVDPQLMIVLKSGMRQKPRSFAATLELLSDLLFRRGQREHGVVLLTPSLFQEGAGVHFMAIGPTLPDVRRQCEQVMQRLS
jgi:hypothetical protein